MNIKTITGNHQQAMFQAPFSHFFGGPQEWNQPPRLKGRPRTSPGAGKRRPARTLKLASTRPGRSQPQVAADIRLLNPLRGRPVLIPVLDMVDQFSYRVSSLTQVEVDQLKRSRFAAARCEEAEGFSPTNLG